MHSSRYYRVLWCFSSEVKVQHTSCVLHPRGYIICSFLFHIGFSFWDQSGGEYMGIQIAMKVKPKWNQSETKVISTCGWSKIEVRPSGATWDPVRPSERFDMRRRYMGYCRRASKSHPPHTQGQHSSSKGNPPLRLTLRQRPSAIRDLQWLFC